MKFKPIMISLLFALIAFVITINAGDKNSLKTNLSPSSLKIITYNVQFLPGLARAKNKRAFPEYRARQIAEKMTAFEIIALNETFDDGPRKIIHESIQGKWGKECHILYGPVPKDSRFNGGLSLISKYPFQETHTYIYRNFSSVLQYGLRADGFAAKGILHACVELPETSGSNKRLLDVFVTHMEARDDSIRRKQYGELAEFLSKQADPTRPFLLMGDLNTKGNAEFRSKKDSDYQLMWESLKKSLPTHHLVDSWLNLHPDEEGGTKVEGDSAGSARIDYILFGNPVKSSSKLKVSEISVNPYADPKVKSLSDHAAVEAILNWKERNP